MEYRGLTFKETCAACPEQYDVYKDGENVAYVRLRWGYLSCECPFNGEEVYSYTFNDEWKGCMDSQERELHLNKIAEAINNYLDDDD